MGSRQSITDHSGLARGQGPGLPGTPNTRETTRRGKVAIAPEGEADSMTVTDKVNSVQGFEVPAGHWTPIGTNLPQVGNDCLIVFDDDGDVWVPTWSPY